MKLKSGAIVVIIGSKSVFPDFLGRYGVVNNYAYGDKWEVELNKRVCSKGSLVHTVHKDDLRVVGYLSPE